jgi:hypothetical protein
MKNSIGRIALIIVFSSFIIIGCSKTTAETTESMLPTEVPPTAVLAPTETPQPTATKAPTSTPAPTVAPTIPPIRLFLNDTERVAAVYPETVEMVQKEQTVYFPNPALGISFDMPVNYALELQSEPEVGAWEMIGGSMDDGRLLSLSIGIIPREYAPGLVEVQSWHSPNPAGSLSTSEESYEYEDGFGVIFTELYPYRGHYGIDVVFTLVLDYDESNVIGIGYFLSEEIYSQDEIEEKIELGIELLQAMQATFKKFDAVQGVLGTSQYRILTGICPTDTDETYGYTQENPVVIASSITDPVAAALMGPVSASQFFETLLYNGEAVSYLRLGSISTEETILDEYQVLRSDGTTVVLYVDQYRSAPYRVPSGFDCIGILNPEYLFEFEE